MITDKLIFTEEEKKRLKQSTSSTEIGMIHARARKRYILSFGKDVNIAYEVVINGELPILKLSDSDSEKVKQAILSDVKEILQTVTKSDFESVIQIGAYDKADFDNALRFLIVDVLNVQISAYDYYRLNIIEVIKSAEQKATEWYEMPKNYISEFYETLLDISNGKKKLQELPIVPKTTTPEKYFLPTYRLVDVLFSGTFPIGEVKMVNMAGEKDNRKGKTAYTLMMLNFDELGDGIKISRELSIYDQQVWNSCVNLMLNRYRVITPSQIYKWMGYESTMGKKEKDRIMESINTIIRARVFIDNENERKLYKRYPEISLNTPLLAAKIITAKSGSNEVTAIEMLEIPDLFTVAEERGQITTIPFEVLEKSAIDKSESNLQLLTYLTKRIIHMKHDSETSRKILLQAIHKKCEIDTRQKKHRLPEKLKRVLDRYTEIKWISGYELTDNEIIIKLPTKN